MVQLSQLLATCDPSSVPPDPGLLCKYITAECSSHVGFINYLQLHYCFFEHAPYASWFLIFCWTCILFGIMIVTCNRFFIVALEQLAETLRLSPAVAGATLLSLGNGAPDVIMQLAALSKGGSSTRASPEGLALALSEPLGTGLFVGNIVLAGIILVSSGQHAIKVPPRSFTKDVLFYLGAVTVLFISLLHGKVYPWQIAVVTCYYIIYVLATIYLSRDEAAVHVNYKHDLLQSQIEQGGAGCAAPGSADDELGLPLLMSEDEEQAVTDTACWSGKHAGLEGHYGQPQQPVVHAFMTGSCDSSNQHVEVAQPDCQATPQQGHVEQSTTAAHCAGKPTQHGFQLLHMLEWPFLMALSFTMPIVGSTHAFYRKSYALVVPLLLPPVLAAYWGYLPNDWDWHSHGLQAVAAACLLCSLVVLAFYPNSGKLPKSCQGFCMILSFVGAMFWMEHAANELVGVVVALGRIFDINSSLLGATLLAWGSSSSDMMADLAMARDGYPTMAVTACFGSPLFVLLGGLLCTLASTISSGSFPIPLDPAVITLYCCSIVVWTLWAVVVPCCFNYTLGKKVAVMACMLYATCQIVYVTMVLRQD